MFCRGYTKDTTIKYGLKDMVVAIEGTAIACHALQAALLELIEFTNIYWDISLLSDNTGQTWTAAKSFKLAHR